MSDGALRVLVVADDPEVAGAIERVVTDEGDTCERVLGVESAVRAAEASPIDIVFVDLRVDDGASLALCHHLPTIRPDVVVHALVHPTQIDRGGEALSLGAASVIVIPPTGDAIARVLASTKLETARLRQVTTLEQLLARERRRLETYDRLVRFARGSAQSDAIRTIVEGVAQLSGAKGVALYASFGNADAERVRLAALGTATDLPATSSPADLSRLLQLRQARAVPLMTSSGELGLIVLDHAPPQPEPEIAQLADLAAAMLSIVDRHDHGDDRLRVYPQRQFRALAERMLTLSERHERRASLVSVRFPSNLASAREEARHEVADLVRTTDALCSADDGDLLVFLPETGGLGAQACRRRILARLRGERRSRPKAPSARASDGPRAAAVVVGVATFPHDGTGLSRLIRAARTRADEEARSSVHALGLEALSLSEVVDALIARPILDAGPRSPYPLDVALSALFSFVVRAVRDALRGGEARVVTTLQPGLGAAAAARQVCTPRVLDIRTFAGCEDIEAVVIEAEHAHWVCCGRVNGERFVGVHAADALLADVVSRRLLAAGGSDAG